MEEVSSSKKGRNEEKLSFPCTFPNCPKVYSRRWKLQRHICSHTSERPYKCTVSGCSKAYQCQTHLSRHIRTFHNKVKLACTFHDCKATFNSKESLIAHSLTSHEELSFFPCEECPQTFSTKPAYIQHKRSHRGVVVLTCDVCNRTWPNRGKFKRHLLSHVPRQCEYCEFTAYSIGVLQSHVNLNHRTPLICDDCNKSFHNKAMLREHVLVHLPPKVRTLFKCPHVPCRRSYFQERNLNHHIRVFHNKPRFYCPGDKCRSSYTDMESLHKHVARKHRQLLQ